MRYHHKITLVEDHVKDSFVGAVPTMFCNLFRDHTKTNPNLNSNRRRQSTKLGVSLA